MVRAEIEGVGESMTETDICRAEINKSWTRFCDRNSQTVEADFITAWNRPTYEAFLEGLSTACALTGNQALLEAVKLSKPFYMLNLSVRAWNCLKSSGIKTIGDLADKSEVDLLRIKNLGLVTLREIKFLLREMNIGLKP